MNKINILVTGLCLSRNRGGQAMALSFMNLIKHFIPNAEFTFAVASDYLELERKWGNRFSVKVIGRNTMWTWFIIQSPFRVFRKLKHVLQGIRHDSFSNIETTRLIHKNYQAEIAKTDCLVDLNGISFVGDGTRSWIQSFDNLTCSTYAKIHNKPFFRFIQSYGPFKNKRFSLLATLEFRRLPCVMARGKLSAQECQTVAGNVPVYSFPDVAITLPTAENKWSIKYLKQFGLETSKYIVLSPSAVISAMDTKKGSSVGVKHIETYKIVARSYMTRSKPILFVPHMTSPILSQCDREVCRHIIESLKKEGVDTNNCHILDEELDCRELKSLIEGAELAIVSRYHALVAALSTGVPAIAIGWNDKYKDILDFYGSSRFVVDARDGEPREVAGAVIQSAESWSDYDKSILRKRQPYLEDMVTMAGKICAEWILNKV